MVDAIAKIFSGKSKAKGQVAAAEASAKDILYQGALAEIQFEAIATTARRRATDARINLKRVRAEGRDRLKLEDEEALLLFANELARQGSSGFSVNSKSNVLRRVYNRSRHDNNREALLIAMAQEEQDLTREERFALQDLNTAQENAAFVAESAAERAKFIRETGAEAAGDTKTGSVIDGALSVVNTALDVFDIF